MGSNQAKSIAVSKAYGHIPVIHSNYFQILFTVKL